MAKRKRLPANWRQRIEIISENSEDVINYELRFRKDLTPKGFEKCIATFAVDKEPPHYVDGPWVEEKFQRRGLGTSLYERAMSDLGSISTKWSSTTDEGRAAWKSLMRRWPHQIDIEQQEVTVFWQCRIPIF